VTLSNGNVALMLAMARRAGLPWDAYMTGFYKPDPRAYEETARMLDIAPADLCIVAAQHGDLAATRACGRAMAFVERPLE
jgi:2-haloacid dehalogenase